MSAESTVSRRVFGNLMRQIREDRNVTRLAAGLVIETSPQTLMRLEDGGSTKISTAQVRQLLESYRVSADEAKEALDHWADILEQAKASRVQGNSGGYWKAYTDQVAPNFPRLLRLEAAASGATAHQPMIVPGLLQTPEYRRAIIRIEEPNLSDVDLARRVELSALRKARLDDPSFRLEALISEAVLRHQPGGGAVMGPQLRWMAEVGQQQNVSVRVVPFSAGAHPGLSMHVFIYLTFPEASFGGALLPPVIFAEGAIGSVFHEHQSEVGQYESAIERLRAVALTEESTRDLVWRTAKEYAA